MLWTLMLFEIFANIYMNINIKGKCAKTLLSNISFAPRIFFGLKRPSRLPLPTAPPFCLFFFPNFRTFNFLIY